MRFSIAPTYDAACLISPEFVSGEVDPHVERNSARGNFTPIARFFAWRPVLPEGFHLAWRVDCFVPVHELSWEPRSLVGTGNGAFVKKIYAQSHFGYHGIEVKKSAARTSARYSISIEASEVCSRRVRQAYCAMHHAFANIGGNSVFTQSWATNCSTSPKSSGNRPSANYHDPNWRDDAR